MDTKKMLSSHIGAFKLQYGVQIVNTMTNDLVQDTMSSNMLQVRSRETFTRYVRFAKPIISNKYLMSPTGLSRDR